MSDTLQQLGDLLIKSIPTILFFILLTFYLKAVLFKPLARILEERRKATEGVRELAQRAFEQADSKTSEFERALEIARMELHQEHEALRRRWREEQEREIAQARAEADQKLEEARREIAREAERAQADLNAGVEMLGEQMVRSLLRRRTA